MWATQPNFLYIMHMAYYPYPGVATCLICKWNVDVMTLCFDMCIHMHVILFVWLCVSVCLHIFITPPTSMTQTYICIKSTYITIFHILHAIYSQCIMVCIQVFLCTYNYGCSNACVWKGLMCLEQLFSYLCHLYYMFISSYIFWLCCSRATHINIYPKPLKLWMCV